MKEGYIEVTGGKVWYIIHNETAEGTPLLILHGGPGSSSYSLQGLKDLATDRPVILYDQLGCGKSDRPDDDSLWTLDRFVEEVAQVRKGLELKKSIFLAIHGAQLLPLLLILIIEKELAALFSPVRV